VEDKEAAVFSITVPPNSSATFVYPFDGFTAIALNGRELAKEDMVSGARLRLVSGVHRIEIRK
jgi:hypothetical protein